MSQADPRPLRTFVALELPPSTRSSLATAVDGMKKTVPGVRFVRPETLHVTLRFFGSTSPTRVPEMIRGLGARCAGVSAMAVPLRGLGFFPSPARPRVVWLGMELPPAAFDLQRRCEDLAVSVGFEPEEHPFRPHLTLGRVEGRQHFAVTDVPPIDLGVVILDRLVLFQSELRPGGASHTVLDSWELRSV